MEKQSVGKTGEDIACTYLRKLGHDILDRNYRKRSGEIDIVSKKAGKVFFSEVKTIVQQYEGDTQKHRPEDNVHFWKLKRLSHVTQIYLEERFAGQEVLYEFYIISIVLDLKKRTAKVKIIEDVLSA